MADCHEGATHRWLFPAGYGRPRRQVSWLAGRRHLPHLEGRGSPLTVAGTAPDLHRLPFSPPFEGRHLRRHPLNAG